MVDKGSKVIGEVLKRIVPREAEIGKLDRVIHKSLDIARREAGKLDPRIKVLVEGSVAKNTWLSNQTDIDIFIIFPLDYKDKDLEKISLPLLKRIAGAIGPCTMKYAQHPYVQTKLDNISIEFIPGFQSKPPNIVSAVDRTPYHTEYVSQHLDDPDQARLMKQFCKGIGVYGAEQSMLGFSGYLCELFVIKYGNFIDALENISRWKSEGIIIPDPTDPNRNTAAAVSKEKLQLFIRGAKAFLEHPSINFFFPNKAPMLTHEELDELLKFRFVTLVSFDKPEGDEEILYSQLRSFSNKLRNFLDDAGFNCLNIWYTVGDKFWVLFEVEDMALPETQLRFGPPEKLGEESEKFRKSCGDKGVEPWLVGGRWQAYIPRKFVRIHDALEDWLSKLSGPHYVVNVLPSCKPIDRQCMINDYPGLSDDVKRFITVSLLDLPPWEW